MESSIKSSSSISLQSPRESSIKIFVLRQTASDYSPKSLSCIILQSKSSSCIRLQSHLHQTTVPPASDYSPACIRLQFHLHQTTVPPASHYSPVGNRLPESSSSRDVAAWTNRTMNMNMNAPHKDIETISPTSPSLPPILLTKSPWWKSPFSIVFKSRQTFALKAKALGTVYRTSALLPKKCVGRVWFLCFPAYLSVVRGCVHTEVYPPVLGWILSLIHIWRCRRWP